MNTTTYGNADTAQGTVGMLIGGRWRADPGRLFPVHDPATGEAVAYVADATAADAVSAVDAAAESLPAWSAMISFLTTKLHD